MNVYEAATKRRTVRKFKQDRIQADILKKFVDAARLSPQGANLQALKYIIVTEKTLTDIIFTATSWAGYIRPTHNPQENERPVAYIVPLVDSEIKNTNYDNDAGAAIQTILLTAYEEGIASCWLGAINKEIIKNTLEIPDKYIIHSLIALGYPAESPEVVKVGEDGSIKYYKDESGVLHVPKRCLDDVLIMVK
ncbi:coenzyme F420:L-glutamate ligase [Oxobacter pfennigii]|uniref:Coenzyme F420:L-glutamate ligase n=1 Tax=Oxobacter pfennigii TaxID=36849 RepID=A0A0N8NSS0_9CLOT|nr:nitroreductase family protein [Oxobacter pfennigii]KPU42808.1 coenzyme F420:L-glutamate ligase [Oxobacter pfennigii]